MAVAKSVLEVEGQQIDWVKIDDVDGNVWKYVRKGETSASQCHVEASPLDRRVVLIRDADGVPLLRQDEPGLPSTLLMAYSTPPVNVPGLPVVSSWQSTQLYKQEA